MTFNFGSPITGALTGTTAVVAIPNTPFPMSVVLNSADLSRSIQLSFDNGVTFLPAITPTYTATGQLVYVLTFPVTTIKFTGAINDTFTILS